MRKLVYTFCRRVHSKPLLNNQKIAIVGGGPGGLTLARLLQMNGAHVKVYERDAYRGERRQSYALDLHEDSGLLAAEKAGLIRQVKANFRPGAEKARVMDGRGNVLLDDHTKQSKDIDEDDRLEIDRGPLLDILLDSLKPDTVMWNSRVTTLKPNGEGWKIEFENGSSSLSDIVIGADGTNSKIRSYVTDIKPVYSGVTIIEGTIGNTATTAPDIDSLLQGGKLFVLGNELSLVISSKEDGSLVFWTGMKCDEKWAQESGIDFSDTQQVLSWFKSTYSKWNEAWNEVILKAKPPFIPLPQYCMPLDQSWSSKANITLLGDAAHVMPPYAGEGVNMAMADALDLFESLQQEQDIPTAISKYEAKMLERSRESAKITLASTEAIHSPEGVDYVLGLIGGGGEENNLEQDIEDAHLASLNMVPSGASTTR